MSEWEENIRGGMRRGREGLLGFFLCEGHCVGQSHRKMIENLGGPLRVRRFDLVGDVTFLRNDPSIRDRATKERTFEKYIYCR